MQYKLWDWTASEYASHNSFFRNSCQYLHSSISSQAYWVLFCFLCTKENVKPVHCVLAMGAVIDVHMPWGNIFLNFPCELTV